MCVQSPCRKVAAQGPQELRTHTCTHMYIMVSFPKNKWVCFTKSLGPLRDFTKPLNRGGLWKSPRALHTHEYTFQSFFPTDMREGCFTKPLGALRGFAKASYTGCYVKAPFFARDYMKFHRCTDNYVSNPYLNWVEWGSTSIEWHEMCKASKGKSCSNPPPQDRVQVGVKFQNLFAKYRVNCPDFHNKTMLGILHPKAVGCKAWGQFPKTMFVPRNLMKCADLHRKSCL